MQDKFCDGGYIKGYTTFQAAKAACSNDVECGCILDLDCDGGYWATNKGSSLHYHRGHCTWTIGKC